MNEELKTDLMQLSDRQINYVIARSKSDSINEACVLGGMSQSGYYSWENRDQLELIAKKIKVNRLFEHELLVKDAV